MACKRSAVRSRLAPPLSPSSRGLGHCPFTAITGVRIPLGTKLREYMKRKIVFASALATLFIVASALAGGSEIIVEPDYFSGFFVGATGAFHMTAFNGNSSIVAPEDVVVSGLVPGTTGPAVATATVFSAGTLASNNISSSSYDGYGGVQGAWVRFLTIAGIWVSWASASGTIKIHMWIIRPISQPRLSSPGYLSPVSPPRVITLLTPQLNSLMIMVCC